MKTVHDFEFFLVQVDEANKLIRTKCKPSTENMTSEQMKVEITEVAKLIAHYKPYFYIGNDVDLKYAFQVDEQNWVATTLAEPFVMGQGKKFANIQGEDLIAKYSVELAAEEVQHMPFEIQYFSNEEDALKWFGI